jgi:2-C-methyl-D-erythritol 4-phosphate cytidylyltransferase / 2-C-methyl-D-erythritol 2,4-cyclodiphosphate synthase
VTDAAALIVAAGAGRRFGGDLPKVFVDLAGSPLFVWALRAYDACPEVDRLLLAVAETHLERAAEMIARAGLTKPVDLVTGGSRRQDTVFAGLLHLADEPPEIIAIHDGARPLVEAQTILNSLELARNTGACIVATAVTDTLKRASDDGTILESPDRRGFWRAQTPQTFRYDLLRACYERIMAEGHEVTDDASVLELCGVAVHVSPGPPTNIKVTTQTDLLHAEALIADRTNRGCQRRPVDASTPSRGCARLPAHGTRDTTDEPASLLVPRVGMGYDVHALVPGRRLILGGVDIPHERGLAGHSDADVLFHAIADALLGAVSAGDIGQLFPDTDAAFAGADSAVLCRHVADLVRSLGYAISNVDATVIAQRPRLQPHIATMRENIAQALGLETGQVSVKATTTERLGFAGREEGIAAEAVAALV